VYYDARMKSITIRLPPVPDDIADVVGSIDRGPSDLSAHKKEHLRNTGYGRKRPR
jgi:hypothetical protein